MTHAEAKTNNENTHIQAQVCESPGDPIVKVCL